MWWELWDLRSGNRLEDFASEESALSFVRLALREHGQATVRPWSLTEEPGDAPPIEGDDLISRALLTAPAAGDRA